MFVEYKQSGFLLYLHNNSFILFFFLNVNYFFQEKIKKNDDQTGFHCVAHSDKIRM